jgi:hypothetical protein
MTLQSPSRPDAVESARQGRHFLRAILASKVRVQVGEPVRLGLKLKRSTADAVSARIGGALGAQRYVTFATAGIHRVPVTVAHPDGRTDQAVLDIEVVDQPCGHPHPLLRVTQEPTNPFLLHCGLKNVEAVHRAGVRYDWGIAGYGDFSTREPYFVVDSERLLLDRAELDVPFDLHFTVVYPDGEARATAESFRVFNDYAWFKTRGVLKPRVVYAHRAAPAGRTLAASCTVLNDEDEPIELTSRQFEILYDDADRVILPDPPERFGALIEPRSRQVLDCGIARGRLPKEAFGYAFHFHGRTRSGLKVELSVFFEHYTYKVRWSHVESIYATELLERVKSAVARSACEPLPPGVARLSLTGVRNFVDAMAPTWSPAERVRYTAGLDAIMGGAKKGVGQQLFGGDADAMFLGQQCLQDEEPPTENLVCRLTGQRGKVYVPSRIVNAKKGDVILAPGGPLGFIGGLLQQVQPAQRFSHCGIMSGNFYKMRHSTASDEWLQEEIYGRTILDPDAVGTEGFRPESVKYIWPGTIDQTVEEAFLGSPFQYRSADGKKQKAYRIAAFSKEPVFFETGDRHIVFPLVVKPDPLVEGDAAFTRVRPTLVQVAEKAKEIRGHYRFFCYSNGAISFVDDTAHRAPDRGPGWWASGTRATVCSTMIIAAINDVTVGPGSRTQVRVEGPGMFTSPADLEKAPPTEPDKDAEVDSLTREGLYLYTEDERKKAAEWLYGKIYGTVLKTSGDLGRLFTDAPSDFANQICNTFAFDYTDREFDDEDAKDSDKWKNPGPGRTVSPDDILRYWDRPTTASEGLVHGLYGTGQRMVYREGVLEEREIGKWAKRERIGKLTVEVKYQGKAVPGADVKAGGQVVVTGATGKVSLDLPEGDYEVDVAVFMNDALAEGRAKGSVKDQAETVVTIELPDPPAFFRIVVIGGHVRIKDEENFGKDEFVDEGFSVRNVYVGPSQKQDAVEWTRKMGGEIRVVVRFDYFWKPNLSVDLAYNVKLYEGASENTDDLDGERGGVLTIAKDAQNVPLDVFVRNDDEDDDDYVSLNLLVANLVDIK